MFVSKKGFPENGTEKMTILNSCWFTAKTYIVLGCPVDKSSVQVGLLAM